MKLTRRRFLQVSGAAAGTLALRTIWTPDQARAGEDFPGYADRYGMLTDTTLCIGCRLCEMACSKVHGLPEVNLKDATIFEKKRRPSADILTVINRYSNPSDPKKPIFRKMQCMHCNEPACVNACLVGALKKQPEGQVTYNQDVCIGCRYCMNACPFSMPAYTYDDPFTPVIRKCTNCYERVVKEGRMPACAEICPPKATIFGKRSDLINIAKERIAKNPDKYVDHIYGETEVGGTGWLYLSAVPFEQLDLPINLGKTPYVELTRDWLNAVPAVLVLWPALLMGLRALSNRRGETAEAEENKEKDEVKR